MTTPESQLLRDMIRSGSLAPEAWRDQEQPDPKSQWERAVREIYRLERAE